MRAGTLRHRITFEQPDDTQGRSGEVTSEFVVFAANVPASIEPLGSREYFAASQIQSDVSAKIRIRWMPGIHERMRIRHESTEFSPAEVAYYDIESVQPDATLRREILLYVKKRSTEGFRQ